MKTYFFILLFLFLALKLNAQDFWIGYGSQLWGLGSPSLINGNNTSTDNKYAVFSPINLIARLDFDSGLYFEYVVGKRTEWNFLRYKDPSNVGLQESTGFASGRRGFHSLEMSSSIGYRKSFKRWSIIGENGLNFSRYLRHRGEPIPPASSFGDSTPNRTWITEANIRTDLNLGLGLSYLLRKNFSIQLKFANRIRIFQTQYSDYRGRSIYKMPSYSQVFMYGLDLSVRYNLWE